MSRPIPGRGKHRLVWFIPERTYVVFLEGGTWVAQEAWNVAGKDPALRLLSEVAEDARRSHKPFFMNFEDGQSIQEFLADEDPTLEGVRQLVGVAHCFATPVVTTASATLKRLGALPGSGGWREQFRDAYFTTEVFDSSHWVHDWYHDQIVGTWCFEDFLGSDHAQYRLIKKFKLLDEYYRISTRQDQSTVVGFRCSATYTAASNDTHLGAPFTGEAMLVPDNPGLPVMFGSFWEGERVDGSADSSSLNHQSVVVYALPENEMHEMVEHERSSCGGHAANKLPVERHMPIDVSIAARGGC